MSETKNKIKLFENNELIISQKQIENKIFSIRGVQVMLDRDLAEIYQVPVKRLNEQVKRNIDRFPQDFMFQLTHSELDCLRSQNATLKDENMLSQNTDSPSRSHFATLDNKRGKNIKYIPYVFTEQGVAGLSGVLKSETAAKDLGKKWFAFSKLDKGSVESILNAIT